MYDNVESNKNLQPVNLSVMRHLEVEFVDHAIHSDRATDQLQLGVLGIAKNKMFGIKLRQFLPPDASRNGRDMINVRLSYHCGHCVRY